MGLAAPGEEGAVSRSGRNGCWLQTPLKALCGAPMPRISCAHSPGEALWGIPMEQGRQLQRGSSCEGVEQQPRVPSVLATAEQCCGTGSRGPVSFHRHCPNSTALVPAPPTPMLPMS